MKNTFSTLTFLVAWIGLAVIIILAFSSQCRQTAILYINNDLNNAGQVKAALATESITTYTEISALDAKTLINKKDPGIILIDVSNAYKSGHIPGAISLPLKDIDKYLLGMDKNKNYIIYCRNNTDSLVAIQKLVNSGFLKLSRISGGYNAWVASKYKTEK